MDGRSRSLRSLWTDVDGLPIHAFTSALAPPDAPPVVLVHGLGLSATYMLPTAVRLAPDYRVYAPDLPGFGRSGKPRAVLDVAGLADALAAWMGAAGLERAALLGNSFGCQIIVECAARHPERVERAILQGPTTPREERSWFWQFVRWRQNPNPNMAPIARADYRAAGYRRVLKTFQYSIEHDLDAQLPKINAPVLVVRGSRDPICRQGWAQEVAHRLPEGRLVVIPGVHHTLVFTHALELVGVCRPFLDSRRPAARPNRAARPPQPATAQPAKVPPLADFDSASGFVRALGGHLHGHDFPLLGMFPRWTETGWRTIGATVNALPTAMREQIYAWSGWAEALDPDRIGGTRAEHISRWAVASYPLKRYPAAMIGSSNGALMHLCAGLGIPWLPQTVLIPVRRLGIDPDEPQQDLAWGRGPGARLLGGNPDLVLHQMWDPNQDHLMIRKMSYFRVKFARLPEHYRRFLLATLEPGATLFVAECNLRWPSVKVGERHVFQIGALGGASPDEYRHPSARVADFLARSRSRRRGWQGPAPDAETPEAEWGFEPALYPELEQFAREHGFRLRRIVFDHPEDPSPLVADVYRAWYRRRRLPANRLLMPNFIIVEPYWALRTGSVPFWTVFNVQSSADALERYLDARDAYDEINLLLFSHGVDSVGVASAERWRSLTAKARRGGALLGIDDDAYPRDFASFTRYHYAIRKQIRARYPLPAPLTLRDLDAFLDGAAHSYDVRWMS